MGALKSAFWSDEEADKIFYERYLELVEADTYNYKDIDIMLFTILNWPVLPDIILSSLKSLYLSKRTSRSCTVRSA